MKRRLWVALILVLSAGCNKTSTTPTSTTPDPYVVSDVFSGTLSMQGTQLRVFSVVQTSQTVLTLASLKRSGTNTTVSVPLTLVLGTPTTDASTCTPSTTLTVSPALTAHFNQQLIAGTYCVSLTDPGNLTDTVDFGVRINQSANATPVGKAGTEAFSTNLYRAGSVMRTFATSQSGSISVMLNGVSPATSVGFGLGVPGASECFLYSSTTSTPGTSQELSASADSGAYCVKVFDTGLVADRVLFDMKITHQ